MPNRIIGWIRGIIMPKWIQLSLFIVLFVFVRFYTGALSATAFLILPYIIYTVLCNLHNSFVLNKNISWLLPVMLVYHGVLVAWWLGAWLNGNIIAFLINTVVISVLYIIGHIVLVDIMFNGSGQYAAFEDTSNPTSIKNYPIQFSDPETADIILIHVGLVMIFETLAVPQNRHMFYFAILGLILILFDFKAAFIPDKVRFKRIAESIITSVNDKSKINVPHIITKATAKTIPALSEIASKAIVYSVSDDLYMTNEQAINYYRNLFGPDPEPDACWEYFYLNHRFDYSMDAIATFFGGMKATPDQFVFLSTDYAADQEMKRLFKELQSNVTLKVPQGITSCFEARNMQINEYRKLSSGRTGETKLTDAIRNMDLGGKYYIYPNLTISTLDGTSEHDIVLVCKYGIFTFENKNRETAVTVLENRQIIDDRGRVISNSNGVNAIDQSERHIAALRSVLPSRLSPAVVKGAVVFSNEAATVINQSDYHILTPRVVERFIKSTRLQLTDEQIDSFVEILNSCTTSALRFKFTNISYEYNQFCKESYCDLGSWLSIFMEYVFNRMENKNDYYSLNDFSGDYADKALVKKLDDIVDRYFDMH